MAGKEKLKFIGCTLLFFDLILFLCQIKILTNAFSIFFDTNSGPINLKNNR